MEFIRRAKYIAGSYSLLTEHSYFNISSRMISNSRFAEAIIGKYTLPDEYDLPPVSYVYYDPAFARDEGEQLILLSSYLMTLNHFRVSMFHTAYENHFYRAVKLQCQQLFLALSQSLPWQREVRELREIYREIGSRQNEAKKEPEISGTGDETLHGQTEEDRQGQEAANRRLLTVKKRTERTLAFIERQEETRFSDRNGASKPTLKPAVGMSVRIGMGQGRMAASSWKSEQAKAFFWRVQRSSAWEQSLLFQAAGVTSLVGLMKLLQRMEPERWRREAAKLRERLEVMAASGEFEKALKTEFRKTEEIRQDFLRETREVVAYLEKEEWETFIGELVQKRAQFSEETDSPFFQWLEEHVHRSETKENVSLSEQKRSFLLALSQQVARDAAVREERMEKRRRRIAHQFPGSASERQLSGPASGQHFSEPASGHQPLELAPGHRITHSDEKMSVSEKRLLYEEVMEAVSYLDQEEWKEFREELFQYRFPAAGKLLDVLDAEKGDLKIVPNAEAQEDEAQESKVQETGSQETEEIQKLSPVLQWIRKQRESREEAVPFGEEKLSFLKAMSGELERLKQADGNQDAGLDLLLQESRVLGNYMTWRTEAKAAPGQNPSETILEYPPSETTARQHLSELVPEYWITALDEDIPVSEKRFLYEEVMEAVSYLNQEEWKEFREELFQYRFRTTGKLLDAEEGKLELIPDTEAQESKVQETKVQETKVQETEAQEAEKIQILSPVLQWIRKQRESREETVSFGEEKLSFLNAMRGELERLELAEKFQILSPIFQWISRQGISRQEISGKRESRQETSGLWQEDGSEGNRSKLVYRVQSRLEELIFPNGKAKRMVLAPGTYSSLLVQNLWMQAAKGEKAAAPGIAQSQMRFASQEAAQAQMRFASREAAQDQMRFAGQEAAQDQVSSVSLETALEMVEQLRTERLRTERLSTVGSEVLKEAGETMLSSYRPASLVITQTGAGRGKRSQEAGEGTVASLNTKIETEVVRQVKEQVTDIQFISKSGEVRDDQTAADREYVRKLAEQLERQQQELEMLRGRQTLVYENPGISKLSKSVIRKVQSQLNQERMRRGI